MLSCYRHCSIPSSSISYSGDEFNSVLKRKYIIDEVKPKHVPGCGEEECLHVLKTFDELCKQIRSLKDLPLKINAIDGIDPVFRLTEVNYVYLFIQPYFLNKIHVNI